MAQLGTWLTYLPNLGHLPPISIIHPLQINLPKAQLWSCPSLTSEQWLPITCRITSHHSTWCSSQGRLLLLPENPSLLPLKTPSTTFASSPGRPPPSHCLVKPYSFFSLTHVLRLPKTPPRLCSSEVTPLTTESAYRFVWILWPMSSYTPKINFPFLPGHRATSRGVS